MARVPAVILLLACSALSNADHVKNNTLLLAGGRYMHQNPFLSTFYNERLRPPPYLNSLLNQVLDLKGGGHTNYLHIYVNSWTTNQINSDLTVDVQFTALVNSQSARCSAHITAFKPKYSNPTLVPGESFVHCSPSGGASFASEYPRTSNNLYRTHGLAPPAYLPFPSHLLNAIPNRLPTWEPPTPQLVYATKYVPMNVPQMVPSPPRQEPLAPSYLPAAPSNNPPYPPMVRPWPFGIPQYSRVPTNGVAPDGNYLYR